jgi:hypothetical protein
MKHISILLALLLSAGFASAQHLQLTDTKFYCNGHEEPFGELFDVIQTHDGGFLFGGNTLDSGGGIIPVCTSHWRHAIIGRLDSLGNVVWIKNMCEVGLNPQSICETPDGGFATMAGPPDSSPLGMLIFRYDSAGNLLWQKNYGRNAGSGSQQIISTPDHGFLILGSATGIDSDITVNYQWPPITFQPIDWILMKLDSLGNKQWVRTLGTSGMDESDAVFCDGQNYYLVGETTSKDHDCADVVNFPGSAVYTIKLDSAGNVLWSRACRGGIINKVMYDDRDHSILVIGRGGADGVYFKNGFGYDDMFLMKLDTAANFKWGKLYGKAYDDKAFGLCKAPNGGYLLAGESNNQVGTIANGMLVITDSNGNASETKIITGDVGVQYNNIFPSLGGYAALGISYSSRLSEGNGWNCGYKSSGAIILSRLQLWPAGVPNAPSDKAVFRIAPNPARDGFRIRFEGPHTAGMLFCSNSSGQTVLQQKVAAGTASLSISSADWPAGNYLVCWQPEGGAPYCEKLTIH